ncbi:MAG: hypothetical protein NTV01_10690 [Bacteroidia bacterium]|nr:hypothetical protein [Bacteroidia bacterium]
MEFVKVAFVISLFISLCKGGACIGLGILLLNYVESLVTLFTRRAVPEDLPDARSGNQAMPTIRFIGILFILLGIGIIILGSITMVAGISLGSQNLNLKF